MVLFIDCQIAGISGDMILSSLVDIGANKSKIIDGVKDSANFFQGSKLKKWKTLLKLWNVFMMKFVVRN